MLLGGETWAVRRESELALERAEIRMVRRMCGVKLSDKVASAKPREGLGLKEIGVVGLLQRNRLRWYGHILRQDDSE